MHDHEHRLEGERVSYLELDNDYAARIFITGEIRTMFHVVVRPLMAFAFCRVGGAYRDEGWFGRSVYNR